MIMAILRLIGKDLLMKIYKFFLKKEPTKKFEYSPSIEPENVQTFVEDDGKLLTGIRWYSLVSNCDDLFLRGSFSYVWPSNQMTAICDSTSYHREKMAEEHLAAGLCRCGIYAKSIFRREYVNNYNNVFAVCVGWGNVIIGEDGWRAQHVKIDSLYINFACRICGLSGSENIWVRTVQNYSFSVCENHIKDILDSSVPILHLERVIAKSLERRYEVPVKIGLPS